jgi:hypothetical protein
LFSRQLGKKLGDNLSSGYFAFGTGSTLRINHK